MKEELIKVIAKYLGSVMTYNNSLTRIQFERACANGAAEFINQEAAEIAGKVLAVVGEKDLPYDELFDHMANEHGVTLTQGELGDIIHIARGGGQKTGWEDAPRWANYLAMDANGYWWWYEEKPQLSKGIWAFGGERSRKTLHKQDIAWNESLQARPK